MKDVPRYPVRHSVSQMKVVSEACLIVGCQKHYPCISPTYRAVYVRNLKQAMLATICHLASVDGYMMVDEKRNREAQQGALRWKPFPLFF